MGGYGTSQGGGAWGAPCLGGVLGYAHLGTLPLGALVCDGAIFELSLWPLVSVLGVPYGLGLATLFLWTTLIPGSGTGLDGSNLRTTTNRTSSNAQ